MTGTIALHALTDVPKSTSCTRPIRPTRGTAIAP